MPVSKELQIFDYESRALIQELEVSFAFDILDIDWSNDGRRIATSYRHWGPSVNEWSLQVWYRPDPNQGEFVGTSDVTSLWLLETVPITDIAWSSGGEKLAVAKANGDIEVWGTTLEALELSHLTAGGSPPESYVLNTGHIGAVNAIVWHPTDNILATGGEDGIIKLWDMENNAELISTIENTSSINVLDWHPDGNLLAVGDADGLIKIWNISNKTLIDSLEWHHYMVHALDWSPDGNYISSAARDHSLHIWDVSGVDTD